MKMYFDDKLKNVFSRVIL